jgi:hypothetical protein
LPSDFELPLNESAMRSPDFLELMKLYARQGIDDWKRAPQELRKRAQACLGMAIAEHEAEANITIHTIYNGTSSAHLRFIPMPKRPTSGIERCFFLPVREIESGGQVTFAFELFLLVAQRNCLAFRFEPAHYAASAHNYGHVQLSRKMLRKTIDVNGIPDWVPVTYPAFPMLTSEPLKVFLCVITAVHGYHGGSVAVLQEIFQRASRASELAFYLDELKKMLC